MTAAVAVVVAALVLLVPAPPVPPVVSYGTDACPVSCTTWPNDIAGCLAGPPTIHYRDTNAERTNRAHELGHAFDCEVLEPKSIPARQVFALLLGRSWRAGDEELFADSYALCSTRRTLTKPVVTPYGLHVDAKLFKRLCLLIREAAAA